MIREKILEIAKDELGYVETYGNRTKYGLWFGLDGVAWCGIFVSFVYFHAGLPIKGAGFLKGFAGCQTFYDYAKRNNLITKNPEPGDIVLYDWNSDDRFDHTGIYVGPLSEGDFLAIEGNTSFKNDSNGGSVMERKRYYKNSIFVKLIK